MGGKVTTADGVGDATEDRFRGKRFSLPKGPPQQKTEQIKTREAPSAGLKTRLGIVYTEVCISPRGM